MKFLAVTALARVALPTALAGVCAFALHEDALAQIGGLTKELTVNPSTMEGEASIVVERVPTSASDGNPNCSTRNAADVASAATRASRKAHCIRLCGHIPNGYV